MAAARPSLKLGSAVGPDDQLSKLGIWKARAHASLVSSNTVTRGSDSVSRAEVPSRIPA